jgi:hypothetical protein
VTGANLAPAAGPDRGRLAIGRARFVLRAAPGSERPWMDGWNQEGRFLRDNGALLEDALAPLLDDGDETVWIIRRLDLSICVSGGERDVALGLATALAAAIARVLRGDGDGGGIVRFASAAAYLARLLGDLARGDAFERWYHQGRRQLAALPVVDAIVHAVATDPETGRRALALLAAEGRIDEIVAALGDIGAARLLRALAPPSRAPPALPAAIAPPPPIIAAAVGRWRHGEAARLVLFAHLLAISGASAGACGAAAATALRASAAGQARHSVAARRAAGSRARTDAATRLRRGRRLTGASSAQAAAASPAAFSPGDVLETRFAGIFLLWRSVIALGLDRLLPEGEAGAAARLTLAATLAGPERHLAMADPALHWLTGHDGRAIRAARAPPGLAQAFARHIEADAAPRRLEPVEQRHGRLRVIQDRVSEDWIRLLPEDDDAPSLDPAPSKARPIGRDLAYFGLSGLRDRGRFPWVLLARAAYGELGRRLPGLDRSSAAWLAANVVAGTGRLVLGDVPELVLPPVAMDLVLRVTGIDKSLVTTSEGVRYRLRLAGAADA